MSWGGTVLDFAGLCRFLFFKCRGGHPDPRGTPALHFLRLAIGDIELRRQRTLVKQGTRGYSLLKAII